jgi:hypothetical protein
MDQLVVALGPAFAAGFAIQRLLEILDPILDGVKLFREYKKIALAVVSLVVGGSLALGVGLRVLQPLGIADAYYLDIFVTALIISGGSEGFNSIMKFLGYAKEGKKAVAAEKKEEVLPVAFEKLELAV